MTLINYAFVKPGVVMILNRGRRHWVITLTFWLCACMPVGSPFRAQGETNTIALSFQNQSAKFVEIVLPQIGVLSRPHPISKALPPGKML